MNWKYRKLLQHPKWQKMRLLVLDRAGFACEKCGDTETQLQVHHLEYRRGEDGKLINPWDYELSELQCLCAPCHESVSLVAIKLPPEPPEEGEADVIFPAWIDWLLLKAAAVGLDARQKNRLRALLDWRSNGPQPAA